MSPRGLVVVLQRFPFPATGDPARARQETVPGAAQARQTAWVDNSSTALDSSDGFEVEASVLLRALATGLVGSAPGCRHSAREERLARALDWCRLDALPPGAFLQPAAEGGGLRRFATAPDLLLGRLGGESQGAAYLWVRGGTRESDRLQAMAGRALACLQQRAQASSHRSSRRERELGARAAGIVHDLRNQLTLASGLLERVRSTGEGSGEMRAVLRSAHRLAANTLQGEMPGAPRLFELRPLLVREARAAGRSRPKASRSPVRVGCPADLQVFEDPTSLARVLRNLMSNALEASPTGSAVHVVGRRREDARIEIEVLDQGRGMDRERMRELFLSGVSGGHGTGWGSRALSDALDELDADFVLDSAPGQGTRAQVLLRPAPVGPSDQRLVLLDPDADRREERLRRLRELDREVLPCSNPSQALRLLSGGAAALIMARGTSGAGLGPLQELLAAESIPCVLASATSDAWLAECGALCGMLRYAKSEPRACTRG